ncbi:MAG TPA: UDP-N-acetylmuramoyl-tripeptide--D-alanyl-D-alanine ligase [Longimicrobiales bacterium]|nr:UDP-N-acetylmuramoyl-tripeptide--D-alanyl-D-alanine ligase [Longimicrobiales bacterium]
MTPFEWSSDAVRSALDAWGLLVEVRGDGRRFSDVGTDSRTTTRGELFVALRGEHFDGHDFVAGAVAGGATGVIVDGNAPRADLEDLDAQVFVVTDTLRAYGALARARRERIDVPVVAITGSSGKTTTKELLRSAIGAHTRVHATEANLNNRIGLPRTLLATPIDVDAVVLEAGTSEPGEVAALAEIADPDVAVVITVGEAHLEKLGSFHGVLEEKLDLIRGMRERGTAFVGESPDILPATADTLDRRVKTVGFGPTASPDARGDLMEPDGNGHFAFRWRDRTVRMSLPGRHVALDALIALAVVDHLGYPVERAVKGVASYTGGVLRDEVRRIGALTLVADCYNSNPLSARAALDALATRRVRGPRIAFLGTMREMGDREAGGHRDVLASAAELPLDLLVATGSFVEAARSLELPFDVIAETSPEAAYDRLRPRLAEAIERDGGATLLLKASRGVSLERLVPRFEADFGHTAPGDPDESSGSGSAPSSGERGHVERRDGGRTLDSTGPFGRGQAPNRRRA